MRSHIYRPVGPSTPFPSRCVNCFAILLKSLKSKILKICAPPLYRGVRGLRKYHDQTPRREQLLIATAVALGVSVSVGGALTIQSYSRAAAHNEFAAPATQFTTLLSRALDQHLNVVRTLSDLLRDAEAIDRWRFHELAAENLGRDENWVEAALGCGGTRAVQRYGRNVDRIDSVAVLGEKERIASGAASDVERTAAWQIVDPVRE